MPENKIRVLEIWSYYLPTFAGGAIRYNQLTPGLRKLGIELKVLTPRRKNTIGQEVINETPIQRVYLGPFRNLVFQSIVSSFSIKACPRRGKTAGRGQGSKDEPGAPG